MVVSIAEDAQGSQVPHLVPRAVHAAAVSSDTYTVQGVIGRDVSASVAGTVVSIAEDAYAGEVTREAVQSSITLEK